ncbi:MAG: hypothetical protein RIC80_08965 [Cyclobacteriaceae bacterium]
MEPSDFDKAIRNKLSQQPDLHRQEIANAKLAVWSQVDRNLYRSNRTPWYLMVAAALILLIGFSVLFVQYLQRYEQELTSLRSELNKVQQQNESQSATLSQRDQQLSRLEGQLSQKEVQLVAFREQQPQEVRERIVHRVDTVYVTEVQYLTVAAPTVDPIGNDAQESDSIPSDQDQSFTNSSEARPTFIAISSPVNDQNTNQNLKVRFGSFAKKLQNP